MLKTYSELIQIPTFEERFNYLKLGGSIGELTFGYERYLNQMFYTSKAWRKFRREILIRDDGYDLGVEGHDVFGRIEVHHINPISIEDIERGAGCLMDPENVICASSETHKAIHYGDGSLILAKPVERTPNDTSPWLC